MELNYILEISYFHTNTHTEMFALLINCIIDDRLEEMQYQVYQVHDVDELKQCLIDVWHGLSCVINVWKYEILSI